MKGIVTRVAVLSLALLCAWPAASGETGMSHDDTVNPGAPAPHLAPPGGNAAPRPLSTNATPTVPRTGVAPQGALPPREVQPGEETPRGETSSDSGGTGAIRPRAAGRDSGDDDDIDDQEVERRTVQGVEAPGRPAQGVGKASASSGGDGTQTEDELYVGRKAVDTPLDSAAQAPQAAPGMRPQLRKPADRLSARPPTVKGPGAVVVPRENCGTFWTAWGDDPEADANPCPASCERGERLAVRQHKSGDVERYQGNYRCYLPELVVNQPPGALREPGAPPRRNCGTFWTARQDDPNADVNPCPANCERGELRWVRRGMSEDKSHYEMNYQCYMAEPGAKSAVSAAQSGTARPAGSNTVTPVTGTSQGVHVAGAETASSQSAVDAAPPRAAAAAGREISTSNIEGPGTQIVSISNMTPTSLTVRWRTVAGASGYVVHAVANGLNHSVTGPEVRQPANLPNELTGLLIGLAPGVEHTVWVGVNYPDGKRGTSDQKVLTTPPAENPRGFTATANGPGSVFLVWEPSTNASHYVVEGSHLPRTETAETGVFVNDLPPGRYEWTVVAVYSPGVFNVEPSRASFEVAPYPYYGMSGKARYRVMLNGFRVAQETFDNPLQLDGKGDEIYIYVHADERERAGFGRIRHDFVRTPVFGDKNGFPDVSRVRAGSAGESGGLRRGDTYPGPNPASGTRVPSAIGLPTVLWEGELEAGRNFVLIVPTVWEWDGDAALSGTWHALRWNTDTPQSLPQSQPLIRAKFLATRLEAVTIADTSLGYVAEWDRLIGLHERKLDRAGHSDYYDDRGLVLTREAVENELMRAPAPGALPPGTVAIRYQDAPGLGTDFGGDYTLYLRVERLP